MNEKISIKLSILVPTVPARLTSFFPSMMEELLKQAENQPVEILGFFDNKKRTVGQKRNDLLDLAQGDYLCFIDDDDRVAPDYVSEVVQSIALNPRADCIVYDTIVTTNGEKPKLCKYGIEYKYQETPDLWTGKPAHTMVWKSDIAKMLRFPDKNYGEDSDWARHASQYVRNQARIDKVLYYYDFNTLTTETREPQLPRISISQEHDSQFFSRRGLTASICIATRNKDKLLKNTLKSIFRQNPPFKYEVVIVDDGSNDNTAMICRDFQRQDKPLKYIHIENYTYRNPSVARNVSYKNAKGEILILQSDEVVHKNLDTIEKLCKGLTEKEFRIATVFDCKLDDQFRPIGHSNQYTGVNMPRPLFFLGSIHRSNVYKIGGNSEDFTRPGHEDDYFAKCLLLNLRLKPQYMSEVIGYHQTHPRLPTKAPYAEMKAIEDEKLACAKDHPDLLVGGPPWELEE